MSDTRCSGIAGAGSCWLRSSPCILKANHVRSAATGRGETPSGLAPPHSRLPAERILIPTVPEADRGILKSPCRLTVRRTPLPCVGWANSPASAGGMGTEPPPTCASRKRPIGVHSPGVGISLCGRIRVRGTLPSRA
jgi:hypothetical protein